MSDVRAELERLAEAMRHAPAPETRNVHVHPDTYRALLESSEPRESPSCFGLDVVVNELVPPDMLVLLPRQEEDNGKESAEGEAGDEFDRGLDPRGPAYW